MSKKIETMSQQKLRRTLEETLEICRDIAMIVATKHKAEERKNVSTSTTYVTIIMKRSWLNFVATCTKFVATNIEKNP